MKHRHTTTVPAVIWYLCVTSSAMPRVAPAQASPQPALACREVEGAAHSAVVKAQGAVGVPEPGRVLRWRAHAGTVQDFQSDRSYPPFFLFFTSREAWFDPAAGVERARQRGGAYPGSAIPDSPFNTVASAVAAWIVRDTLVRPQPDLTNAATNRPLNPWAVIGDFLRAPDATVQGECSYRDYPRLALGRAGPYGAETLLLDLKTWVPVALVREEPHPTWGQVQVEYVWSNWDDVTGGGRFPQTAFRVVDGAAQVSLTITDASVLPRDSAPPLALPDSTLRLEALQMAFDRPQAPDTVRVADHAWLFVNPMYTTAAVLERDTVFLFDATLSEARARQDSALVARLFPGRHPVVLVVTDLAWPHIGGVRFWVAQGATIVSHRAAKDFLERLINRRWTRDPDLLERLREGVRFTFRPVSDSLALAGGTLVLYPIDGIASEGALMAWLPQHRFLWASDYIQTTRQPTGYAREVLHAVGRTGIRPDRVAAEHLPLTPWSKIVELHLDQPSGAGPARSPEANSPSPSAPASPRTASARISPGLTAADLRTRLSAYAHDSMLGREAGTLGNVRATNYLATELAHLGVEPAGEGGTYFQTIPLVERAVDATATMQVDDHELALWQDYFPLQAFGDFGLRRSLDGVRVVYGGRLSDTTTLLSPDDAAGRVVLLLPSERQGGLSWSQVTSRYRAAAGVAVVYGNLSPATVQVLSQPQNAVGQELPDGPTGMFVTPLAAALLLGASPDSVGVGHLGGTLQGSFRFVARPVAHPARNVIGLIRGGDPALRNQYVAIGAHNDHVGRGAAMDHDSLWAFNHIVRPAGAESPQRPATDEEWGRIRTILDSLRALRPGRADSVFNGADDDGSGSVTLLGIAEALLRSRERPLRSILLVWHTAEEKGLYGSQHFTEHTTVPRDSIVAQLNLDMIGRGTARDLPDGAPGYLQLIGSRRLSTALGDLVEAVNRQHGHRFLFDYRFDADGHPKNYYCRSDHYMYARFGIPIVFFTTGSHQDYPQRTDEPQYIDYEKMARVGRLVLDVARTIADLDHRLVVDKPKPDPYGQCQQ